MPRYFMRDTPLQALEQLMMSQPGQKPRGGGMYRSPFHYTPKDVACEYCQNYVRKHPCRLCECTCLEERIEAGVLELNEFVRDCFAPSMELQLRKRKPYASDAYVDEKKTQIGYEISFTKYFYKDNGLRSMEDILNDLNTLEKQTDGMLLDIFGGLTYEI